MNHGTTAWCTVSIFLLLMLASFAWGEAGPEQQQEVERARAERLAANVPQTPEALLQVFKDLLANPDVDGHEFCELRLGIDRKRGWVESKLPRTIAKEYLVTSLGSPPLPPAPFQFGTIHLDRQNRIYQGRILFYKNPNFPLTPALTRQILGEPEKIEVTNPKFDDSSGEYRVRYLYLTEKYVFVVSFHNGDEADGDTRRTFRRHTPEQIRQEREYRQSFAVHKGYRPVSIVLQR